MGKKDQNRKEAKNKIEEDKNKEKNLICIYFVLWKIKFSSIQHDPKMSLDTNDFQKLEQLKQFKLFYPLKPI